MPGEIRMSRRTALSVLVAAPLAIATHRPTRPARAVAVAPGLSIVPRDAWAGGRRPTSTMGREDVRFLLVHHTAGSNDYGADDVPSILQSIFDYHTGPEKGWPDVCYNFFVDRFGTVWEGRAGSMAGPVVPDATGGNQGFSQLVCVIGDFTSAMPTDAAIEATVHTLGWLATRSSIPTAPAATVQFVSRGSNRWPAGQTVTASTISGHRDMSQTACPGDTFYPFVVSTLRERVHAAVGQASPTATVPTTTVPPTQATLPPTTTTSPPTAEPPATTVAPSTAATAAPTTASAVTVTPVRSAEASTSSAPVVASVAEDPGLDWRPVALIAGGVAVGAGAVAVRRGQS